MNWKCHQRLRESGLTHPGEANAFKIGYVQAWGDIAGETTAAKKYATSYWAGHRAGAADRAEHYASEEHVKTTHNYA